MKRKYNFYGWEQADVTALDNSYIGINTPYDLYDALSDIWCADTCAPRMRDEWTKDNKTLGQCSITAFLVQDIFGGKVYGILRPGGNYHCYNVVDGKKFDLTSEQFGDEVLDYTDNPEQFREVHFSKEEKRLRYEFLKSELKKSEHTTLCYIINDNEVLMMLRNKKENDINEGKWLGVGGHFEAGENADECVVREVNEETGLTLTKYKARGTVTFRYKEMLEFMHLFTASEYEGSIKECDEGELNWIKKDELLSLNIWEGDRIFLKQILDDEDYFNLKLLYDDDGRLIESELIKD